MREHWLIQVTICFYRILIENNNILGFSLRDPESFSKRFYKLFNGALGVPKDATVKEIEVDLTEEDDDDDGDILKKIFLFIIYKI